jgi:hypothetical protein
MTIDIFFQDLDIHRQDEDPQVIVLTDEELLFNSPEFWFSEPEIGEGMPVAYNGFPPSEWL